MRLTHALYYALYSFHSPAKGREVEMSTNDATRVAAAMMKRGKRGSVAVSGARKLTEAEDNAIGRRIRRRQNKRLRGWLPHAKR